MKKKKTTEEMLCAIEPPAHMTFGCPPDWTYKDLPRMAPKVWVELLECLGEANYRILTRVHAAKGAVRGQIMISPEGMLNLETLARPQDH